MPMPSNASASIRLGFCSRGEGILLIFLERGAHVFDPVGEGEGEFLNRGRARFLHDQVRAGAGGSDHPAAGLGRRA